MIKQDKIIKELRREEAKTQAELDELHDELRRLKEELRANKQLINNANENIVLKVRRLCLKVYNKICQNLEFGIFKISYDPKPLVVYFRYGNHV